MNNFIGSIWKQNCGDSLIILEKTNKQDKDKSFFYRCQFQKYPYEILACSCEIKAGRLANHFYPSVCGVGTMGIGFTSQTNKKEYEIWHSILKRCYKENSYNYKNYGAKGITVCEEWLNFQNFVNWINKNKYGDKYTVDKDVLSNIQHKELKIYSPETCLILPEDINVWLAGDNLSVGVRLVKSGNFCSKIGYNYKEKSLGTYSTFWEAKQIYAKEKYEIWKELIDKYTIPSDIKNILLKYDFSWYWLNK